MKAAILALTCLATAGVVGCRSSQNDVEDSKSQSAPRNCRVKLWLPRFDGRMSDGKHSPSFDEIQSAIEELPCVKSTIAYGDNNGGRMVLFQFAPTQTSDLGHVVIALSKLNSNNEKPVAVLDLAESPISAEKFSAIKNELEGAKGIDWENTPFELSAGVRSSALSLSPSCGANLFEIRAA